MDCIFCKIVNGEIPTKKIYEDENVLGFYDVSPQAPVHILLIPKKHITSAADISEKNSFVVANIFEAAAKLARELNLLSGFRIVTNCGESAGQSVKHLHFHLMGDRAFSWPPG